MTEHAIAGIERRVRQQVRGRSHEFFAICQPGFERLLTDELSLLGCELRESSPGGVSFSGRIADLYRVCLHSEIAVRVLLRLDDFAVTRESRLVKKIAAMPWELYLKPDTKVVTAASSRGSRLFHTGLLQAALARGIAYRMREVFPGYNPAQGSQLVLLRMQDDVCQVSLDACGDALYRRGIRVLTGAAPLRETSAAALLRAAGATRYSRIYDPCCGSGSIVSEVLRMAEGRAAGQGRGFAFSDWPVYSAAAFEHLAQTEPPASETGVIESVIAADLDAAAVALVERNVAKIDAGNRLRAYSADIFADDCRPPDGEDLLVISNLPYGHRCPLPGGVAEWFGRLAQLLKSTYVKAGLAFIVPDGPAVQALSEAGLRPVISFRNGGIRVSIMTRSSYENDEA